VYLRSTPDGWAIVYRRWKMGVDQWKRPPYRMRLDLKSDSAEVVASVSLTI
jgi:hypothetical protein